ncbi:uncharacterized protein LOC143277636 [Babylonia areolata]|uniref:uncharacterized protein LOC143277636 n=1 Tax=Babylonia areolata TaxID=304850 RepID=UPI003FD1A570
MAATEVEDLAALVGIEILPDSASEEQIVSHHSEEELKEKPQIPAADAKTKESETHDGAESGSNGSPHDSSVEVTLSALEAEFASRYTSQDAEFMSMLSTPILPPPCITSWWTNHHGDRSRGGGGQGWGRGRGRGRGHHHSNQHPYRDRRDDYHHRSQDQRYHGHHHRDNRRDYYRDREPHERRDRSPVHRDRY